MTDPRRRAFLRSTAGAAGALALSTELDLAHGLLSAPAPFRAAQDFPVALAGCGRQGRAILAELAKMENVRVVAVCDPVLIRRDSAKRRARGSEAYPSLSEGLAKHPEVQAVVVATPSHLHREPAIEALEAGKHVYCEAPLATTVEDGRAIVAAAAASDRVFTTGMLGRVNPIYNLAYKFWRTGSIREPATLSAQYHKKTSLRVPSRSGQDDAALNWKLDPAVSLGLAGEFGTHQFDVFHWFLGEYPSAVRGSGRIALHDDGREMPDTEAVTLEFPSGLVLDYSSTLANSYNNDFELLAGTMGSIKLAWSWGWLFKEADAPTQGWEVYANRQQFHNEEGITLIADATKLAAQDKLKDGVGLPEPPLYYGIEDFLNAATAGGDVTCTAAEGLRASIPAIEARAAIASGERRVIDPTLYEV
ncbi:MAG: Gfo/Idh/MocA family protein [Planctomycetota bacterium]|jgi:predicted dehydrogenase